MLDLSIGNMSAYGIGLDEIMDAFGIEKEVDIDAKSSQVGGVSKGETTKVTSSAVADISNATDGHKLTTAKVEILAKVNGVQKTLTYDIDLSSSNVTANQQKFDKEDRKSVV